MRLYTQGITNKVSRVELNKPPITTVARLDDKRAPSLRPRASGINAKIVTRAVMRIGRSRIAAPSRRAS
jgi:hypothetical protein